METKTLKKDDKWVKTRTRQKKEIIAAVLDWEPKAVDIHCQDTFKSNGLWVTHCWYSISE